jgi:hypothetical protein
LFGCLPIANVVPTVLDHRLCDRRFDRARTLGRPANCNYGSRHGNHFAAHHWPPHLHIQVDVHVALQS